MGTAGIGRIVGVSSAVVTAAIAASAYAGEVGLLDGGISFGDSIDAQLPLGSLVRPAWRCWFHPTYLVAAIVVLGLGWLMQRTGSAAVHRATLEPRHSQLHN